MLKKQDHQKHATLSQGLEAKRVVAGLVEPIHCRSLGEAGNTSGSVLPTSNHTSKRTYGEVEYGRYHWSTGRENEKSILNSSSPNMSKS